MTSKKLKLNMDLRGLKSGTIIDVDTDKSGIILDRFWRSRLADSKIDGCVELVSAPKKDKKGATK